MFPPAGKRLPNCRLTPDSNSFAAASYDNLVDAPAELGKFDEFGFDEAGAHFRVVVDGKGWRRDRLETDLHRIANYRTAMMGGPPFKEYTFFIRIRLLSRSRRRRNGARQLHGDLGAIGRERCNHRRARIFSRLERQAHPAANARAGGLHQGNVHARAVVRRRRHQHLRRLHSRTHRLVGQKTSSTAISPARSANSIRAPRIAGRASRNRASTPGSRNMTTTTSPIAAFRITTKAKSLGVLLDLAIRDATDNHKSLDDVLRRMNDVYAKQGRFYDDSHGVQAVAEEVAGVKLDDFFRRYVAGTDEIPYQNFFNAAGPRIESRNAQKRRSRILDRRPRAWRANACFAGRAGNASGSGGIKGRGYLAGDQRSAAPAQFARLVATSIRREKKSSCAFIVTTRI